MKKELKKESPFEYLRQRDNNKPFSKETVENWYVAREFVLNELKAFSFGPGSSAHLHAVVNGDSPLMLAVVRQLALSAHFLNYSELDQFNNLAYKNRTVISLVSKKNEATIISELEKEENLCNLLKYCKYSVYGAVKNDNSFLDIELEIVKETPKTGMLFINEEDVQSFEVPKTKNGLYAIDTRMAVFARRAYNLGAAIDSLPYEDIFCPERYGKALDTFQYKVLQDKKGLQLISTSWETKLLDVKNGLSNLFCSDCFESRERDIIEAVGSKIYEKLDAKEKRAVWEKYNHVLSLSEHSRWNVEKLILGFRPLNDKERLTYESLFGEKRKAYYKQIKTNSIDPAHLNLCSYRDLRRVDPDNMKYDSFLMLAIPSILDKTR